MNTPAQLTQGANAPITGSRATVTVSVSGAQLDASALLLDGNGKVRSDDDLVFFNHPQQDGVALNGHTITADLNRVPASVHTVAVVASIDSDQPGATFTPATTPQVAVDCGNRVHFTPLPLASGETVVVLVELYRRGEGWKVRAVGQGYANGLAGLATDFGVAVDDPGPAPAVAAQPAAASSSAQVSLTKVEATAPALLAPARQAGQALAGAGIAGKRAAVYLILDHDWNMEELYESFAVQAFAERVLALSANLDDDGTVPVIFSSGDEPFLEEISLDNYRGRIGQLHTQVDWGSGDVAAAMRRTVSHYQESGAADPAFVVAQVGDEPWDKSEVRSLLQNTATLGVFWLFVGFGRGKLAFYKNLNASSSARFTNVAFYDASKNPGAVPGERFYTGLVDAFGAWMR